MDDANHMLYIHEQVTTVASKISSAPSLQWQQVWQGVWQPPRHTFRVFHATLTSSPSTSTSNTFWTVILLSSSPVCTYVTHLTTTRCVVCLFSTFLPHIIHYLFIYNYCKYFDPARSLTFSNQLPLGLTSIT